MSDLYHDYTERGRIECEREEALASTDLIEPGEAT